MLGSPSRVPSDCWHSYFDLVGLIVCKWFHAWSNMLFSLPLVHAGLIESSECFHGRSGFVANSYYSHFYAGGWSHSMVWQKVSDSISYSTVKFLLTLEQFVSHDSLHVSLSVWPSSHSPCSHCGPVGMIVCEWFYYYAKSMCLLSSHCVHDADSLWVIHVRFSWHGFSYYLHPNHVDLVVCGWLYVVRPNWIPSHYPHDCSNLVGSTES